MPPGFQIQTPPDQAVVSIAFEDLPILQLMRIVQASAGEGLATSSRWGHFH
jgi:hypothetical protein